jgi:hypothetical protein
MAVISAGVELQDTFGQDDGQFNEMLVRRQRGRIIEGSHRTSPTGVAHSDLRLATGSLSGVTEWLTASIC